MSYGMNGFVALGKESSWGTAVAVTDYMEVMNESLQSQYDRFDTRNAINALYEPDRARGLLRVSGGISQSAFPKELAILAKAAMTVQSGVTVLSGFLYTTQFVSPQADFAANAACTPYTIEVFRDVTSSQRYIGMMLNRLQLSIAPNQPLMMSSDWIGKGQTQLEKTAASFPGSPANPFMYDSASISLGGSATSRIEALTISIDNQLEGIPALNNSNEIARIRRRGPQIIRVQGTLDFQDITEFLDFTNETERALKVGFFGAQSFSAVLDVPRMVYTAFPPSIRGRDRLTVSFQGEAKYLTTSATALGIYVTNTKSDY